MATNNGIGFFQGNSADFQVLAGTNVVGGNTTANRSGTITAVGIDTNP
jgi:hypothetical protein